MSRVTVPRAVLLTAFAALVVITALAGGRLAVRSRSDLSCVVEDTRTGGGSGIRDWAERLGYSTRAVRVPIREINSEFPSSGNCLITAGNDSEMPIGGDFSDDEWSSVDRWIRAGNTVIVITSHPPSLPSRVTEYFTSELPASDAEKPETTTITSPEKPFFNLTDKELQRVRAWWGGDMSVDKEGPRINNLPQEFHLAGHGNAAVLAGRPLGEGMVYLLLDEGAWTNEGFDQADNAATLARLLKRRLDHGGVLGFDEYRHGYGRVESFTTLFLSLPGAKSFAAMALAWGLFWMWASTRRLSPPDEYRETERRTALEYIESVAAMNQRARAAPLAVNAVLERVRYLLKKRGVVPDSATAVFAQAAQVVASAERPTAPNQEIKLVADILKLKKEIYGTRRDPRAQ